MKLTEYVFDGTKYHVLYKPNKLYIGDIVREVDGDCLFRSEAWIGGPVLLEIGIKIIALNNKDYIDGPGEEDGPWAKGWPERSGQKK